MDWLLAPFEYDLSTWHPLAVHLPVVLLPLGALAAVVYAVTGGVRLRLGLLVLFAVASAATWWAVETGQRLYDEVEGTPIVDELIAQHRTTASWTLRLSGAVTLLLAGLTGWRTWQLRTSAGPRRLVADARWARLIVVVLAGAAALLVVYAGHVGGVMVWGR
ncbi:MAG: DUF2231 domain-containing protein [Bacteroidota bacterium]